MLYRIWLTTLLARNRNPGCPHKVLATVNSYNTQGHRITKSSPHSNRPLWLSALVCRHFHSPTPLPCYLQNNVPFYICCGAFSVCFVVLRQPSTLMRANARKYAWLWEMLLSVSEVVEIFSRHGMTFTYTIYILARRVTLFMLLECLRSHDRIW